MMAVRGRALTDSRTIAFAGMAMMAFSLCLSPALLSTGMILLAVSVIIPHPKEDNRSGLAITLARLLPAAFFLFALLSFFLCDDKQEWLNYVRVKLPFLIIPFAFFFSAPLPRARRQDLLDLLMLSAVLVALISSLNYLFHRDEIDLLIRQSKPVPIVPPQSHIYFSVILSFAVFYAGHAYFTQRAAGFRRGLRLTCALTGLAALHLLTARTGLLAFYAALLIAGTYTLIRQRAWKGLLALLLLITLLPALAYLSLPSLRLRIENSIQDFQQTVELKNANNYSLRTRVEAWKASRDLFLAKPLTGWGGPEMEKQIIKAYDKNESKLLLENMITPHNQYLENLAAGGIFSFLILLLVLILPIVFLPGGREPLYIAFSVILIFAFCFESMLERQVGIAFFLLMREILMNPAPQSSTIPD